MLQFIKLRQLFRLFYIDIDLLFYFFALLSVAFCAVSFVGFSMAFVVYESDKRNHGQRATLINSQNVIS